MRLNTMEAVSAVRLGVWLYITPARNETHSW